MSQKKKTKATGQENKRNRGPSYCPEVKEETFHVVTQYFE